MFLAISKTRSIIRQQLVLPLPAQLHDLDLLSNEDEILADALTSLALFEAGILSCIIPWASEMVCITTIVH